MGRRQRALKRSLDVIAATAGLLVLWPVMLVIAFLIRRSTPGPALFRQVRIGREGRRFEILKFRTMYQSDGSARRQVTVAGDATITPLGAILRKAKLDELPQLWNIVKGDMSLVGPRPDVPGYADRLSGRAARILHVRPGVTGPATLYLRREEDLLSEVVADDEVQRYYDDVLYPLKVRIDLDYLERWSLARDLGYVVVTVLPPLDRWLHLVPTERAVATLRRQVDEEAA